MTRVKKETLDEYGWDQFDLKIGTKGNIDTYLEADDYLIKILEKKEQNVEGSVIDKLLSGPSFKREYELVLGSGFEVHYAFCVSSF